MTPRARWRAPDNESSNLLRPSHQGLLLTITLLGACTSDAALPDLIRGDLDGGLNDSRLDSLADASEPWTGKACSWRATAAPLSASNTSCSEDFNDERGTASIALAEFLAQTPISHFQVALSQPLTFATGSYGIKKFGGLDKIEVFILIGGTQYAHFGGVVAEGSSLSKVESMNLDVLRWEPQAAGHTHGILDAVLLPEVATTGDPNLKCHLHAEF